MHGEYKVPDGKLVAVDLEVSDGRLTDVVVSGDFFLEPDDALDDIVQALNGLPHNSSVADLAAAINTRLPEGTRMLGFSPEAVGIAVRRALGHATNWDDHTFDVIGPVTLDPRLHVALDEVLAAVDAAGLTVANNNGPGQLVAAGTVEQLAAFAENTPRRARLKQLSVAGAFHTHHMAPAVARLEALAAAVPTRDPRSKLLSNADGTIVTSGREYLERLARQVANPVRWDLCMETMSTEGVTGILELAPAGTLTGIAKRNLKGVELFNLNTPDQLDDARAFCESHSASA